LVLGLHSNSQNAVIRLQRRTQRILDIETRIDLNMDDAQKHFERNLQLFVCMVDHRLRSLAVESPDRYLFIADKLQLILIEAGSTTPQRTFKVQFLKKAFKKLLHVT
uniref:Dynein heavy chain n=1 Tax=Heligmosomoides polygyrus TaxID=6339 RepID=A0A183F4P3_HELPZ